MRFPGHPHRSAASHCLQACDTGLSGRLHSTVTLPACSVYVALAERQLMQTMTGLVNEETWTPMEGAEGQRVLKSASSLFAALKKSLGQCSNNVSKGPPMLQLLNSFQVLDASA